MIKNKCEWSFHNPKHSDIVKMKMNRTSMYMCLCTMYLCEASRMAKHKIVDSLFDELVPCSFQDTSSVQ